MEAPKASGPVFTEDDCLNLYYLNELYGKVAVCVASRMRQTHNIDVPITSGVWGGTYLIADPCGKSLRRIWRLYCIVNLPQNSPLDKHENMEKLVSVYFKTFAEAFQPHGLELDLKMWGGRLPHSNKTRPTITMHLEDANRKINWLRPIIVWNQAEWEQSIIYDSVRLVKELKDSLDIERGPVLTDPKTIKYLLQDVVITYRTLEKAHSPEFLEHAHHRGPDANFFGRFVRSSADTRPVPQDFGKRPSLRLRTDSGIVLLEIWVGRGAGSGLAGRQNQLGARRVAGQTDSSDPGHLRHLQIQPRPHPPTPSGISSETNFNLDGKS